MDEETKSIEDGYKEIASDYKTTVKSDDLDHRYIEKFLSLFQPGQKILDIGSGTGNIAHEIKLQHQLDVTAVDISKEMVDLAREAYPDLRVIQMDIRELKFEPESFNGIFANYSLIHVPEKDITKTLTRINELLVPGGYLYLSLQEPVGPMDKDGYYSVVYRPEVKLFINLFSEQEMRDHLVQNSFEVTYVDRRPHQQGMEFPFNKLFIIARKVS